MDADERRLDALKKQIKIKIKHRINSYVQEEETRAERHGRRCDIHVITVGNKNQNHSKTRRTGFVSKTEMLFADARGWGSLARFMI